ncbi:hypothetical protein Dda_6970 [Drechslerella dactyloides]|uniref:Uncharacterized protein n=1 Tax=Drechslerella dactyloides TaxID=74499 RepID=A0AAD6IT54_DREDA|nr:hypothetical protein Dda_6970 [Drechslerella dactyloides]
MLHDPLSQGPQLGKSRHEVTCKAYNNNRYISFLGNAPIRPPIPERKRQLGSAPPPPPLALRGLKSPMGRPVVLSPCSRLSFATFGIKSDCKAYVTDDDCELGDDAQRYTSVSPYPEASSYCSSDFTISTEHLPFTNLNPHRPTYTASYKITKWTNIPSQ